MRYRWLSFALLFLCWEPAASQHLDSIRDNYHQALRKKDITKQGVFLSEIARFYYFLPNQDSAIHYYRSAIKINERVSNDTLLAANFNDLAALFSNLGNFDSAILYYEKAIRKFESAEPTGVAYAKTNLAKLYKDKGLYEKALDLSLSAERILDKYPNDPNRANCYNIIGSTYGKMQEYDNAIVYYKKALIVWRKFSEHGYEASALNNIGNVYLNMGKYDSAFIAFENSLRLRKTLPNKRSTAITLNNLGEVTLKLNRINEAENFYNQSLAIKRELNDRLGQATTLNNLAHCKIIRREYRAAEQYLDEAQKLEREIGGVLAERKTNLELRIELNRAIRNYVKASNYAVELSLVKDSLLNTEKAEALADIQVRYETEKKQQQIEILHTEQQLNEAAIQARNFWITALCIAIASVVIIALLMYYNFRMVRKGKQRVEILMKELHHRVKNNLQILSSVLSLQSQHLTDENALLSVKSTEGRINAMALIHRKLYSDDRNTIVSTRGYFRELIEFLMNSYGYTEQNLKLKADIDEIELDVDKAIPLGLIVNELLSNAFKHAFGKHDNPGLIVNIQLHGHELHVTIRDNGSGSPGEAGEEAKFGMRMVNILVNDLRGKFQTSRTNGTEHSVIIPLT